jgi:hypothetical protein
MTTPDRLAERTQQPTPEAVTREMVRIRGIIEYTGTGDHEDLITYAKEVVRLRESLATPVPGAVSNAMVLVPREPTEAMIEAHFAAHAQASTVFAEVRDIWRAMIDAAQTGQKPGERAAQGTPAEAQAGETSPVPLEAAVQSPPIVGRVKALEAFIDAVQDDDFRHFVDGLREALERIASSNASDMNTPHPEHCAAIARAALKGELGK